MQKVQHRLLGATALALASMLPLSAHALSTWTSGSCQTNCKETGDDAPNVSFSAYSAVINTTGTTNSTKKYAGTQGFYQSTLQNWDGGFGVQASASDTGSPQHSMDNFGYQDMILLKFDSAVNLTQLKLGWTQYDSDITVLAYTGSTAGVNVNNTIVGKTAETLKSANGWSLVNSYADVGTASLNLNTALTSSWWIVTAYNTQLGGSTTKADGTITGLTRGLGTTVSKGYDFVKLYSVSGNKVGGTNNGNVPEPASLALASVAILGLIGVRRRKSKV